MNLTRNVLKSISEEKNFYYDLFCSINDELGINKIQKKLSISKTKLYCYLSFLSGSGLITKKYLLTKDGMEIFLSLKINCNEK